MTIDKKRLGVVDQIGRATNERVASTRGMFRTSTFEERIADNPHILFLQADSYDIVVFPYIGLHNVPKFRLVKFGPNIFDMGEIDSDDFVQGPKKIIDDFIEDSSKYDCFEDCDSQTRVLFIMENLIVNGYKPNGCINDNITFSNDLFGDFKVSVNQ